MSEDALKGEIRRLVRELEETRADLRAERGLQATGEICVTRAGTFSTDPTTINVSLSVDTVRALREGQRYIDEMLVRIGSEIERELRRRSAAH